MTPALFAVLVLLVILGAVTTGVFWSPWGLLLLVLLVFLLVA